MVVNTFGAFVSIAQTSYCFVLFVSKQNLVQDIFSLNIDYINEVHKLFKKGRVKEKPLTIFSTFQVFLKIKNDPILSN